MSTLRVGNLTAVGGTGTITVPTGNVLTQAGTILQVVSTTKTDTFSASVATTATADVTGLSATITPSSVNSKIFVFGTMAKGTYGSPVIKRGATEIGIATSAGSRNALTATGQGATQGAYPLSLPFFFLDSPATTSATTYQIATHNTEHVTLTLYVNRGDTDTDNTNHNRCISSITVMEVAG